VVPIFLAPIVGVANVVPVMAVGMLFANGSRVAAFRRDLHWPHIWRVLATGVPACIAGAYGYTLLAPRWIALLLGAFFILSVPLRRLLARAGWRLGKRGLRVAGAGFGFINGGMTGVGLLLVSALMAAGLQGAALIGIGLAILAAPVARVAAAYGASFELTGFAIPEYLAIIGGGALLGLLGAWIAAAFHLRRIEPRA